MFEPYSLGIDGETKTVVFHFKIMKILSLILCVPTILISVIFLSKSPPFLFAGIWWIILGSLLLCMILPLRYRISSEKDNLKVDLTNTFWIRNEYNIEMGSRVRIIGKGFFLLPAPGGFSIEITSRRYRPFIVYDNGGNEEEISLYPLASYFMSGNYTKLNEEHIKEIAKHLGIGYKI